MHAHGDIFLHLHARVCASLCMCAHARPCICLFDIEQMHACAHATCRMPACMCVYAADLRASALSPACMRTSRWALQRPKHTAAVPSTPSHPHTCPEAARPALAGAMDRYVNKEQGYSLMVPATWERIDKMGADSLFEDPSRRSTSLGITVNPVGASEKVHHPFSIRLAFLLGLPQGRPPRGIVDFNVPPSAHAHVCNRAMFGRKSDGPHLVMPSKCRLGV